LSFNWPIDTRLGLWVAYVKRQLGIETHVSVIKVNVTVSKIENPLMLNTFSFSWLIFTKLGVRVAYVKRQLGISIHMPVFKIKVNVAKNRKSVSIQ